MLNKTLMQTTGHAARESVTSIALVSWSVGGCIAIRSASPFAAHFELVATFWALHFEVVALFRPVLRDVERSAIPEVRRVKQVHILPAFRAVAVQTYVP